MKSRFTIPVRYLRASAVAAAAAPLLASFLVVSSCANGKSGFVMVLHAMGVSVTASYCHS
jgi:hypothetical protein